MNRESGELVLSPFRCKSWRCKRCAPQVNARDAARIENALGGVDLSCVVFLTLTFDPKRWPSKEAAWAHAGDCWKRLVDRLRYRYGMGHGRSREKAELVYVQTWEQHKSEWPHVHALVYCRALAADVRRRGSFYSKTKLAQVWRWRDQVLKEEAVASGFGVSCDADFPRKERGAVAGYLVKLAAELTGSRTKDQTPVAAPKGFRRLRATPHFLEPLKGESAVFLDENGRVEKLFEGALVCAPQDWLELALAVSAERGMDSLGDGLRWALEELELRVWRRPRSAPSASGCSIPEG